MVDTFSILNGAKYFSLGIFQNYLVVTPDNLIILVTLLVLNHRNLKECKKKVLKTKSDRNFASTFVDHQFIIRHTN